MKKQKKYTQEELLFKNLENFQSIDVEEDWRKTRERIGFKKSRRVSLLWQAAAVAILLLGVGLLANHFVFKTSELLIVSTGESKKEILLPDGSHVFLNEYTEFTYPEKFGKNIRQVKINGEGFFQVSRDPGKPFVVNVADMASVEVLGTSFNIESSENGETVKVQVVEGKVAFSAIENSDEMAILVREDQAWLQDGSILKRSNADRNFLSWKTGILYFNQDPIEKVVEELSDYYDQEIVLKGENNHSLVFTSTIDNQNLESVLEELKLILGISTSLKDGSVIVTIP